MSNAKNKTELLRALRENEGYCYIGDLSSYYYHAKDSRCLNQVSRGNLRGLGKKPEKSGFRPCLVCFPERALDNLIPPRPRAGRKPLDRSRAETLRDAMRRVAAEYDLHLEFIGANVYVTTIAGEWYFDYNIRPVVLHHKNNGLYLYRGKRPKYHYHEQEYTFPTPLTALQYIYRHENAVARMTARPEDEPVPTLQEAVQAAERRTIENALRAANGSQKYAAELLGISVKTLYRKRRRYDLKD